MTFNLSPENVYPLVSAMIFAGVAGVTLRECHARTNSRRID